MELLCYFSFSLQLNKELKPDAVMTISEIKAALPIAAVLDHYGLTAGSTGSLACPFHDDKKASMKIYSETNTAYCFAGSCAVDSVDVIITYTADGTKLREDYRSVDGTERRRDYHGLFEYRNDTLTQVRHAEGRAVITGRACGDDLTLSSHAPGGGTFTGRRVRSTAAVPGDGSRYTYRATQSVELGAGFQVPAGSTFTAEVVACDGPYEFGYEYVLRDHLGNGRVWFTDADGDGEVGASEVVGREDYYPFGLGLGGAGAGRRYRYNGKELNEELGLYDYGARWYDPAVARWGQIDPLADEYAPVSPYNYVLNNPLIFIDPDGRDAILAVNRQSRTVTVRADLFWSKRF